MRHFADINASKITRLDCNMVMHRIDSTIYHICINKVCNNMNELSEMQIYVQGLIHGIDSCHLSFNLTKPFYLPIFIPKYRI